MKSEAQELPRLEIRLLGPPEVSLDGNPVHELAAKAQALLFYLAVTAQPQPRTTLASLLWGEMPEKNARGNLRKAIQQLRSALPEHVTIEQQSVGLADSGNMWVDVLAFEERVKQADSIEDGQLLDDIGQLYRGDFVTGFHTRGAPDFESWQLAQQARLRETMLGTLQTVSQHLIATNDIAGAIHATRRIVGPALPSCTWVAMTRHCLCMKRRCYLIPLTTATS